MKIRPGSKSIQTLGIIIILLSAGMLLFSIFSTYRLTKDKTDEEKKIEQYYELCDGIEKTSELFTDEAREYSIDYDLNRVERYWTEATETKTVEKSIELIREGNFNDNELAPLLHAAETLDSLRNTEAQAMLLVSDGCSYDKSALPTALKQYNTTFAQKNLSDEDKLYTARLLLYGESYSTQKESVRLDIDNFREVIEMREEEQITKSRFLLNMSVTSQIAGLSIILGLTLVMLVIYRIFCIRPLQINAKKADVSGKIPLEEKGFSEIVTIARRYNSKKADDEVEKL